MPPAYRVSAVAIALLVTGCYSAIGAQPVVATIDWEPACEGSGITVTSESGHLVLIEAFVEHFAESREWICTYKGRNLVSVVYRHYKHTRKPAKQDGSFTTERSLDRIVVAGIKDGKPEGLDDALKKDFDELMRKVADTKTR